MQKKFCIPKDFHNKWPWQKEFYITDALILADITEAQFRTHWEAKVERCRQTRDGRNELLQLLEKAGLHWRGSKTKQLQRRIWFINEIVGRNTSAIPRKKKNVCDCLHVHINMQNSNIDSHAETENFLYSKLDSRYVDGATGFHAHQSSNPCER